MGEGRRELGRWNVGKKEGIWEVGGGNEGEGSFERASELTSVALVATDCCCYGNDY